MPQALHDEVTDALPPNAHLSEHSALAPQHFAFSSWTAGIALTCSSCRVTEYGRFLTSSVVGERSTALLPAALPDAAAAASSLSTATPAQAHGSSCWHVASAVYCACPLVVAPGTLATANPHMTLSLGDRSPIMA